MMSKAVKSESIQQHPGSARETGKKTGRWVSTSLFSLLLLGILAGSPQLFAASLDAKKLRSLENEVLTAEPSELAFIESRVTRIIQEFPFSAFGHYLLAQVYLREFRDDPGNMGKLKKASELGQQALDLAERSEFGYLVSAQVLDMMGYSDNALKTVDPRFNSKIDDTWRTKFLRAQILAGRAKAYIPLALLEQVLDEEPSASEIVIPYVVALLRDQHDNKNQFIAELRDWNKAVKSETLKHNLAIALSENGEYEGARALYQELQALSPENVDAAINEGIILANHMHRPDEANQVLQPILQKIKADDLHKQDLVRSQIARNLLLMGSEQAAVEAFAEAIHRSQNPMEWVNFAYMSFSEKKEFNKLAQLMQKLTGELPGNDLLFAIQGELLSEKLKNHEDAIEAYQNAILLEPSKSQYYTGLGLAYYRLDDMQRALRLFNQAAKIDPRDATARYNEACVLAILGQTSKALGSLREAISLDPRLQLTALEDSDLSSLRNSQQFIEIVSPQESVKLSH